MAVSRYATAGTIIRAAARKIGLQDATDPYASTDPDYVRLTALLDEVGKELAETHEWSNLLVEHPGIVGDGATVDWDLPSDFLDMVEQTGWNRTSQRPLRGSMSPQLWQYRKAVSLNPIYAEFRLDQNVVRILPAIPTGETVKFEYRSRAWVRPAASGLGNGNTLGTTGADSCVVTGDWVLFDPVLAQRALELAWKEESGFDTSAAQSSFQRSLDRAEERTEGAPVLRLSNRRRSVRLIDITNLPDTGYGT